MAELSWDAIRNLVHQRARAICEYCLTAETNSGQEMQIDHVDPSAGDSLDNLCLACWRCNNAKRQATTAFDPENGVNVTLFHPRTDLWSDHFEWYEGATQIRGRTATGRATVVPPEDEPSGHRRSAAALGGNGFSSTPL